MSGESKFSPVQNIELHDIHNISIQPNENPENNEHNEHNENPENSTHGTFSSETNSFHIQDELLKKNPPKPTSCFPSSPQPAPNSPPLYILKYFDPSWFAMTMGTGGTALCIGSLPLDGLAHLKWVALCLWLFNVVLFCTCSVCFTLRFILYPSQFVPFMKHPIKPFLLGCIPMGMVTCINGLVTFGPLIFDPVSCFRTAQVLFWINTALSILTLILVPFFMFTKQSHTLESMTAIWLLPIVACEVAGTCAGVVAATLPVHDILPIIVAGFINWSFSVPIALGILATLFLRLAVNKLPPKALGVSCMLALGPLGTGSLTMQVCCEQLQRISDAGLFSLSPLPLRTLGSVSTAIGLISGIVLWTMCCWWFIIALFCAIYIALTDKLPFNQGWWGFTFPVAVYTLSTIRLFQETHFDFFRVIGIMLTCFLAVMYSWVFTLTLRDVITGRVFLQAHPPVPGYAAPSPAPFFTKRQQISVYVNRLMSFTNGLCFSVFNPVLFVHLTFLGQSFRFYGLACFAFGLAAIFSNLCVSLLLHSFPSLRFRIIYSLCACFLIAGGALYAFAESSSLILLSRILLGIAVASHSTTKSYVSKITTPMNAAWEQSMLTTCTTLGYVLSPLIVLVGTFIELQIGSLFLLGSETFPGFVIAVIGLFAGVFCIVLFVEPTPDSCPQLETTTTPATASAHDSPNLNHDSPTFSFSRNYPVVSWKTMFKKSISFANAARFISFFGVGVFEMGIPVSLSLEYKYSIRQICFIFLIYSFSSACAAFTAPFLLRSIDFRKALLLSSITAMVGFLTMINPTSISQIIICALLTGFSCVYLAESSAALLSMSVETKQSEPLYLGIHVCVGYLGKTLSALWVGFTYDPNQSYSPVFYGTSAFICFLFILALFQYRKLGAVKYSKND